MLTAKQKDLLLLLHHWTATQGTAPSFEEMAQALGLKSKSGVHRLISALEERDYIRRLPNRARAIEVVRLPQDCPGAGLATAAEVPLLDGAMAATGRCVAVPPCLLAGVEAEDCCAMVAGPPGLAAAGVSAGDIVIIQMCSTAHAGAVVVTLEAGTTRIVYNHGDSTLLAVVGAAGSAPVPTGAPLTIQGRVIALLRSYI